MINLSALHPDMPKPPSGYPRNWMQAVGYDGICAIPLKDGEDWNWFIFDHGAAVLCNGKWEESRFDSFEDAMAFAEELNARSSQ